MPIIKCVYIVEFLFFDPEVSGHYFAMQPDSKFWSDCCIFHSLIPPNAPLPSLIHLCQRLNPVQSDTRACGWEQVCGIWDGGTGPLGASDFQMWHAYEWSPKYWTLGEDRQSPTFLYCLLSFLRGLRLYLLSPSFCLSLSHSPIFPSFVASLCSCFQCPCCGLGWKPLG